MDQRSVEKWYFWMLSAQNSVEIYKGFWPNTCELLISHGL